MLSGGSEPSVGSRLAARERLEVHEADAASADHTCMCAGGHCRHTPRGIARASIASGLTDVQHPIGQSHADRAPPSGGDAGAARAGQLQRIGGHGQRRCGDTHPHHGPDPEIKTSRGSARGRHQRTRRKSDREPARQERFLTHRRTNYVSASRSGQQQKPRMQRGKPRELRCSGPAAASYCAACFAPPSAPEQSSPPLTPPHSLTPHPAPGARS